MTVGVKTKNPQVGQATTKILKPVLAGKILRLTYQRTKNGVPLKKIVLLFNENFLSGLLV